MKEKRQSYYELRYTVLLDHLQNYSILIVEGKQLLVCIDLLMFQIC